MIELIGVVATTATAALATPSAIQLASRVKPFASRLSSMPTVPDSDHSVDDIRRQAWQSRESLRHGANRHVRLVEIDRIVQESDDTSSFYLTSVDGQKLPAHRPGQHLIVERPATNTSAASQRCYTLSSGPSSSTWRITVRRQSPLQDMASFSAWVHREWRVGDQLRVRGPRGNFVLDVAEDSKPVVFLSAGVGITPISAMLHEELSFPRSRQKWVFHQIRELTNAPLVYELIQSVETARNCQATIAISQMTSLPNCASKNIRLQKGKLDFTAIPSLLGTTDATFFMCGPMAWMQSARSALVRSGVPDSQIFDESFGAPEEENSVPPTPQAISQCAPTFEVALEASGKTSRYQSNTPSLLSHMRQAGVELPASCRAGRCGTCVVKLLRGQVEYTKPAQAEIASDEILPCVCHPVSDVALYA